MPTWRRPSWPPPLGAAKLILLTDVRGLLRDPKDEDTLIPLVKVSEVPRLVKDGVISGGMIPKVNCCVEAVRQGVQCANIQGRAGQAFHFGGAAVGQRRRHHVYLKVKR